MTLRTEHHDRLAQFLPRPLLDETELLLTRVFGSDREQNLRRAREGAGGAGMHWCAVRAGFTHHGIDLGDGTVVHFTGEPLRKARAEVARTTWDNFTRGDPVAPVALRSSLNARQLHPSSRCLLALSALRLPGYNLAFRNCEHLATFCHTGVWSSAQVEDVASAWWQMTKIQLDVAEGKIGLGEGVRRALTLSRRNFRWMLAGPVWGAQWTHLDQVLARVERPPGSASRVPPPHRTPFFIGSLKRGGTDVWLNLPPWPPSTPVSSNWGRLDGWSSVVWDLSEPPAQELEPIGELWANDLGSVLWQSPEDGWYTTPSDIDKVLGVAADSDSGELAVSWARPM